MYCQIIERKSQIIVVCFCLPEICIVIYNISEVKIYMLKNFLKFKKSTCTFHLRATEEILETFLLLSQICYLRERSAETFEITSNSQVVFYRQTLTD